MLQQSPLAHLVPMIRSLLELHDPQVGMRQLTDAWDAAVKDGSVSRAGPEWYAVADFIAWLPGYEPNPQFCNRSAGMFDHIELMPRVREILKHLGADLPPTK